MNTDNQNQLEAIVNSERSEQEVSAESGKAYVSPFRKYARKTVLAGALAAAIGSAAPAYAADPFSAFFNSIANAVGSIPRIIIEHGVGVVSTIAKLPFAVADTVIDESKKFYKKIEPDINKSKKDYDKYVHDNITHRDQKWLTDKTNDMNSTLSYVDRMIEDPTQLHAFPHGRFIEEKKYVTAQSPARPGKSRAERLAELNKQFN